MRIAFFGLPLAALLLARDGHEIAWAGICRKAALGTRRLTRLLGKERLRIVPNAANETTRDEVAGARPELIVSWFWTKKLPFEILALAPAIGAHPSLLPRHRGPDPYFWAIDAGDETTGVTVHRVDEEYDTGAVLAQRDLRIQPQWNAWALARALDRPSLSLLREVVDAYAKGTPPAPMAQDESSATAAPAPTEDELAVVWSWPAARVERRVRAAAPFPGAFTEIDGRIVTLIDVKATRDFPRALAPGEATVRPDGIAVVRAGDDAVELLLGRGEDDEPLGSEALAELVHAARRAGAAPT